MKIDADSTNVIMYFKLVDPTTGAPETGLTIADLTLNYVRDQTARVGAIATALALVTTAHTDNYMIEVDSTNCPGLYRADFPDAAFASGVDRVQCIINGAAIDPAVIEVQLNELKVASVTAAVETDSASRTASQANVSALALEASLFDPATDDVTLANGAHGGAIASIELADYSDFTGAAAANPNVLQSGTITVTDQTHFVLSAGSTDNDAYLNMLIVLEDVTTAVQKSVRLITAYVGSTLTVTINDDPDFTIASTDKFSIIAISPAVWNELTANWTKAGSFGLKVGSIGVASDIVDAFYEELTANQNVVGSYGVAIKDILTDTGEIGAAGVGLTALAQDADTAKEASLFDPAVDEVITNAASRTASQANVSALALEASITALNDISVANIIAGITDGSYDLEEILRIIVSAVAGKTNTDGTIFRDLADTKARITATLDANGNRTAMTLDGS